MQAKVGSYSVQTNQGKKVDNKLKVGWSISKLKNIFSFYCKLSFVLKENINGVIFTIVILG